MESSGPVALHPADAGTECILLVEDDGAVRRATRVILERRGYMVLEAEDGEDALYLAETRDKPIDIVVTDVVLPGLGGPALVEEMRRFRPGLPALFISGYTSGVIVGNSALKESSGFIQKPFTGDVLCRKIRELLEA